MHTRVCPYAPQSYMFLLLWNKMELIHRNLPLRGLSPLVFMGHESFLLTHLPLSPLGLVANRPGGKEDPHTILVFYDVFTITNHLNMHLLKSITVFHNA